MLRLTLSLHALILSTVIVVIYPIFVAIFGYRAIITFFFHVVRLFWRFSEYFTCKLTCKIDLIVPVAWNSCLTCASDPTAKYCFSRFVCIWTGYWISTSAFNISSIIQCRAEKCELVLLIFDLFFENVKYRISILFQSELIHWCTNLSKVVF